MPTNSSPPLGPSPPASGRTSDKRRMPPWVLFGLAVLGGFLLTIVGSTPELVALIGFVLLVVMPVPSSVATGYLWHVYLGDVHRPRSWLLLAQATAASVALVGTIMIGTLIALPEIGTANTRAALGLFAAVLIESIPLILAAAILYGRRFRYRDRRPRRRA